MEKKYVDIENARGEAYRKTILQIIEDNVCPFCAQHLKKYHTEPIIKKTKHWLLTTNQNKYPGTKVHLLAILREHAENLNEIPSGALEDLNKLFIWSQKKFGIKGGGYSMRFGDTQLSGATVKHLHAQLFEPEELVTIFIGHSKKDKK